MNIEYFFGILMSLSERGSYLAKRKRQNDVNEGFVVFKLDGKELEIKGISNPKGMRFEVELRAIPSNDGDFGGTHGHKR